MKRFLLFIAAAAIVIVIAGVLSSGRACAHDPRFACSPRGPNRPIRITQPSKSWAFYGQLRAGEEDRYVVETRQSVVVPVQILLDERDAGNPSRPVAKITDASGHAIVAIDLAAAQPFFEPFSRVTYLESPDRRIRFPAGLSTISVMMRERGGPQRYTLAIGSQERFTAWEIPYLLGALYRIHARDF